MTQLSIAILALVVAAPVVCLVYFTAQAARRPRVICLMYHRLVSADEYPAVRGTERIFTIPADRFEAQIRLLKDNGWSFVAAEQVAAHAAGERVLADKSVLLTFDDGCVSVLTHAVPIMRKHGACGISFVTTDPAAHVFPPEDAGQRRMTDDELRRAGGDVLEIGSHAVSHRPLRAMTDEQIEHELAASKRELERVLGRPVPFFAVPGNWYDDRVLRLARSAGYRGVWWSNPSTVRAGSNAFGVGRLNVEGQYSMAEFAAAIGAFGIARRRLLSWIKWAPSRVVGPKYWLPVRKALLRWVPGGCVPIRAVMLTGLAIVSLAVVGIVLLLLRR